MRTLIGVAVLVLSVVLLNIPKQAQSQDCPNGQCDLPRQVVTLPQISDVQIPSVAPQREVICTNGQCRVVQAAQPLERSVLVQPVQKTQTLRSYSQPRTRWFGRVFSGRLFARVKGCQR